MVGPSLGKSSRQQTITGVRAIARFGSIKVQDFLWLVTLIGAVSCGGLFDEQGGGWFENMNRSLEIGSSSEFGICHDNFDIRCVFLDAFGHDLYDGRCIRG